MKIQNIIVSFIIFAVLVTLSIQIYDGFRLEYGIQRNDTVDGKDIMQSLNDLNIISGMDSIVTGATDIGTPTAGVTDIVGGLAALGIGALKVATGIITLPIEIIGVITGFYYIPSSVAVGLGIIFIIYIVFLLIDKYTRST